MMWTFNLYFLPAFFLAVALGYTVFIVRATRRRGYPVAHLGQRFSLHWWNHRTFRVFRILITLCCVARLFNPVWVDHWIVAVPAPAWVLLLGDVLLVGGLAIVIGATRQLNQSWQSGINPQQHEPLVREGLYRLSRNPSFIGVLMAQLGFFLALPSFFSLLCLGLGWVTIWLQTGLEERHLKKAHNYAYQQYCLSVTRWLNWQSVKAGYRLLQGS